jgi:hypothetical protein
MSTRRAKWSALLVLLIIDDSFGYATSIVIFSKPILLPASVVRLVFLVMNRS